MIEALIERAVGRRLDELGRRLDSISHQVSGSTSDLGRYQAEIRDELAALRADLTHRNAELRGDVQKVRDIVAADYDRISELRAQLLVARAGETYEQAFEVTEPLVSVRIATFNRSALLVERAISSVLRQTYENLEVVVVGDGCTDDTPQRIAGLHDPRISFVNLPHQGLYPGEPRRRWMVAGAPAMNEAARRARGPWIAPLDDDDEFLPDHIERLLQTARSGRFEMVYGNLVVRRPEAQDAYELRRYPPAYGHFGFQGALYMAALRFFEYDLKAWVLDEVADWTMCRRMVEAGVRVGWLDAAVTTLYPTGPRHSPGAEAS